MALSGTTATGTGARRPASTRRAAARETCAGSVAGGKQGSLAAVCVHSMAGRAAAATGAPNPPPETDGQVMAKHMRRRGGTHRRSIRLKMMLTARRCRFLRQMPAACAAAGLSWCASTDPSWQTPSRSWELAQRFSSHPPLSLCASAVLTAKGAAPAHLSGQTARQTAARWRRLRPSSSLPPCPAPALQTAQAPTAHRCGRGIAGRGCEQVAAACSVQCPAPAQPTTQVPQVAAAMWRAAAVGSLPLRHPNHYCLAYSTPEQSHKKSSPMLRQVLAHGHHNQWVVRRACRRLQQHLSSGYLVGHLVLAATERRQQQAEMGHSHVLTLLWYSAGTHRLLRLCRHVLHGCAITARRPAPTSATTPKPRRQAACCSRRCAALRWLRFSAARYRWSRACTPACPASAGSSLLPRSACRVAGDTAAASCASAASSSLCGSDRRESRLPQLCSALLARSMGGGPCMQLQTPAAVRNGRRDGVAASRRQRRRSQDGCSGCPPASTPL